MTTKFEELRKELDDMEWNALRQKAKVEYGVKILPEHKRLDIMNLILEAAANNRGGPNVTVAVEGRKVKPGYAKITLLPVPGEPDPFYVCINGWSATIPRNVQVEVPHEVLPSLDSMSCDYTVMDANYVLTRVRHKRAPYQVHEIDDSVSSGKLPYTQQKERQLEDYRAYVELYGRWPTGEDLRDLYKSGGAETLRKQKEKMAKERLDVEGDALAAAC